MPFTNTSFHCIYIPAVLEKWAFLPKHLASTTTLQNVKKTQILKNNIAT